MNSNNRGVVLKDFIHLSPSRTLTQTLQEKAAEQIAVNADYLAFLKSAEQQFAAPPDGKDKFLNVLDLTQ